MGWLYNRYAVLGVFIIGMSLIPFNDALMKQLSTSIPVFEFLVLRGGFMLLGVLCIPVTFVALREVGWVGLIQVFLRGTLLVLALTLLFLSISMVKLATAYAMFFTAPMMISLAAVPLLGERLSPVRLLAVCLGLVGAIVHTKPWTGELSPWMGLAILAAMVYAAYQLVTRMLPQNVKIGAAVTGLQLAYLFWGFLISWAMWQFGWQNDSSEGLDFLTRDWVAPSLAQWGILVLCAAITLVWTYATTFAYRVAEASFVAPIEYIALPLAAIWGVVMLGESQDSVTIAGLVIIILGGLTMAFDRQDTNTQSED